MFQTGNVCIYMGIFFASTFVHNIINDYIKIYYVLYVSISVFEYNNDMYS